MTKKQLSSEAWLEHVSRQECSGETQPGYCRKQGLSLSAFRYWKKRRSRKATTEGASFIELPIAGAIQESIRDVCTIEFPNGCRLRVHATSGIPELAELVAIVRGL